MKKEKRNKETFTQVPDDVFASKKLNSSEKLLISYFLRWQMKEGQVCFMTNETLCNKSGLGITAVKEILNRLERPEYGFLTRKDDQFFNEEKGRWDSWREIYVDENKLNAFLAAEREELKQEQLKKIEARKAPKKKTSKSHVTTSVLGPVTQSTPITSTPVVEGPGSSSQPTESQEKPAVEGEPVAFPKRSPEEAFLDSLKDVEAENMTVVEAESWEPVVTATPLPKPELLHYMEAQEPAEPQELPAVPMTQLTNTSDGTPIEQESVQSKSLPRFPTMFPLVTKPKYKHMFTKEEAFKNLRTVVTVDVGAKAVLRKNDFEVFEAMGEALEKRLANHASYLITLYKEWLPDFMNEDYRKILAEMLEQKHEQKAA